MSVSSSTKDGKAASPKHHNTFTPTNTPNGSEDDDRPIVDAEMRVLQYNVQQIVKLFSQPMVLKCSWVKPTSTRQTATMCKQKMHTRDLLGVVRVNQTALSDCQTDLATLSHMIGDEYDLELIALKGELENVRNSMEELCIAISKKCQ